MIDYNSACRTYDLTRAHSDRIIAAFAARVPFSNSTSVLDFGCGTGNYLGRIQQTFGANCCGVEPSEGMRSQALTKNPQLVIRAGDHTSIPFSDQTFDFAFLTDVIHHVPDLPCMFAELWRVLKPEALLCVATESWEQIEARFYNHFFPSLIPSEKKRYPEIGKIIVCAAGRGFRHLGTEILPGAESRTVTREFIRNVEEKNYSMFRLLDLAEYAQGLAAIQRQEGRTFDQSGTGDSLVWFQKQSPNQTVAPTAESGRGSP